MDLDNPTLQDDQANRVNPVLEGDEEEEGSGAVTVLKRTAEATDTIRRMMDEPKANPLVAIRHAFQLSQKDAAEATGHSRGLWTAWEKRKRRLSILHLRAIRDVFSLSRKEVAWILEWAALDGDLDIERDMLLSQLPLVSELVGKEVPYSTIALRLFRYWDRTEDDEEISP